MNGQSKHLYTFFFIGVLFLSLYGAYLVLRPFVHIIVMGAVLAALFQPLFNHIKTKFGGRAGAAALCTTVLIFLVIILPLFSVLTALLTQGAQTVAAIQDWLSATDLSGRQGREQLAPYLSWLQGRLPFLDLETIDIQDDLLELSKRAGQYLLDTGTSILGNAVLVVFNFGILIFLLFFLIRDGEALLKRIKYLSPLREEQEDRIIQQFKDVSRSVVLGCFLIAILQGIAGGIGLAIAGVPAIFWGAVMAFASLIPVAGTGLVWVPASIYLIAVGQWEWGVFLLLWGLCVVTMIDTILRPLFLKGRSKMSIVYVFLSILGGISYFGALGLLYGPLLLSFAMIMLNIYAEAYKDVLSDGRDDLVIRRK